MRFVWAVACAALAWLICVFLGGFIATTNQPQLDFLGHFLITYAGLIAVVVGLFAFAGGAPVSLVTYFQNRSTPR